MLKMTKENIYQSINYDETIVYYMEKDASLHHR